MITGGRLSENYSKNGMRLLLNNYHRRLSERISKSDMATLKKVLLSTTAAIVVMCLYLNWVVIYVDALRFEGFTLLQLSNSAGIGFMGEGLETISLILRAAIISTTVFWAVFVWKIVVHSTNQVRLFAYLATVITVLMVIGASIAVTAANSWSFGIGNLPPGASEIRLSLAPFIAAVCSSTIMLIISLMYQRQKKGRRIGFRTGKTSSEDKGVRIKTDADYRLMYHDGHNSVGFVADMGEFWIPEMSAEITESMIKSISEELRVCMTCGEFIQHRVSFCTNCGSMIPGKQK